ncbi:FAD-binding oxidoreductase [Actinoplanes sp. NPDC049118]|uniref:NAD(P)/FAD-dependent oxidoreductase n=1 Tax=Actinoplanes sp. NPDC049118 TaxID=3155769 RepID=UPI0033EDAD0C
MTGAYWRNTPSDGGSASPGPPPDRVDVAVVGAGFAGLSIARDLLRAAPGLRVAVLDARHPGYGASGRNAGAVLPLAVLPWLLPGSAGGHDPRRMQRLLHARIGARVRQLAADHPTGEIRQVRMLLIATNRLVAAGLDWLGRATAAAGIEAQHWSGDDVEAQCAAPARAGVALAAWTIHPARLAASLAAEFVTAGGVLCRHTPVAAVVPDATGTWLHLGGDARMRADRVVVCTGGYTPAVALPDRLSARTLHTYMRAGQPLPEPDAQALGGERLFLAAPGPGMPYWRTHDRRLLFGAADVRGVSPGEDADALPDGHRAVDRLLRRRLPAAAGHTPTHRWGGPIHVTRTEVPHLARSAVSDRVVYAVGFSGSGVALALSAGPLVRDLVLGPAAADPEAVTLRRAMQATRLPWRGLLTTVPPVVAHLLRGLQPWR